MCRDDCEGIPEIPPLGGGLRSGVLCAGVEGTGSYGAGLARYLKAAAISVMEIERPKRRHLRRNGKGRTLSMRRLLLGRSWPTTRPENPRAVMVRWR